MRCEKRADKARWWWLIRVTPSGDEDGVGMQQAAETYPRHDTHASRGTQGAFFQPADLKGIPAFEFRTRQSEELNGDAEFEGAKSFLGEHGYPGERWSGLFRISELCHIFYGNWHLSHWQDFRAHRILEM